MIHQLIKIEALFYLSNIIKLCASAFIEFFLQLDSFLYLVLLTFFKIFSLKSALFNYLENI